MHGLYKLFYNMCCNNNKKTNNSLSINEKYNMEFNKNKIMNIFDITKKHHKLTCIANVKTYAIVPF
jgi:hypothetical protein